MDVPVLRRVGQRGSSLGIVEAVDHPECERTLGVGLRVTGQAGQGRKTGAGHQNRELLLADPMQSHHQCRQMIPGQELKLVNREQDPGAPVSDRLPDLQEQACEIMVENARIRPAGKRVEPQHHFAAFRELPSHLERLQHAECPADSIRHELAGREPEERLAHQNCHDLRERLVLTYFGVPADPAVALADAAELSQEHSLADATQARENETLRRAARAESLNGDVESPKLGIATDQRWRRCSGTGAVGVAHRVHRMITEPRSVRDQSRPRDDRTDPVPPSHRIYMTIDDDVADCHDIPQSHR